MVTPVIKRLPPELTELIAAGEVVLHPASVVKELMENALDAGATDLRLELQEGGVSRISLLDNGSGISFEQLPLALERHATSKISRFEDFDTLHTFGFRGEALPSIAAVSKLTVTSAVAGALHGGVVVMQAGQLVRHAAAASPVGTHVVVEDLFYTTPARRKFLKSTSAELTRVQKWVTRFALAHPHVTIQCTHQGKQLCFYPASTTPRLGVVLGKIWNEQVLTVHEALSDESLTIHFTRPQVTFGTAQQQYYFLNGRSIQDRTLQHAVAESYRTLVMQRQYPGVVLFLQLPPTQFDVNVHPSKEEVRFANANSLHAWVLRLLRHALAKQKLPTVLSHPLPATSMETSGSPGGVMPALGAMLSEAVPGIRLGDASAQLPLITDSQSSQLLPERGSGFSTLRIIGQHQLSYMVCERDGELILIDQHAAHERILFEKINQAIATAQPQVQELIAPLMLMLTHAQHATLQQQAQALQAMGFVWEDFGGNSILLRAHPGHLAGDIGRLFASLLDDLEKYGSAMQLDDIRSRLIASMACHSAIRFNQKMSLPEMQALLTQMDDVDLSTNCPHGRPVFVTFPHYELERLFKRRI